MNIYEESNPYQPTGVGGGGFNPVQVADVAGAMERELRAGERRDRLYYDSLAQNDKTAIQNAENSAKWIDEQQEANLKAFDKFSPILGKLADEYTKNRIVKEAQAASMKGWMEPIFAEQETEKFEAEEKNVEEGQLIMNGAAANYESKGGSPIIGERLRTSFTGRNRLAYERARMERLSMAWPSFYASKLKYINGTTDPVVRQQRQDQVVQEFITKTGAAGTSIGMLNKYLYRPMRQVTSKAELAWTTAKEEEIEKDRIETATTELYTGIRAGDIGGSATAFMKNLESYNIYTPRQIKEKLFGILDKNEEMLQTADLDKLAATPLDSHPACSPNEQCTFGKAFSREIDQLRGKVAGNQNDLVQRERDDIAAEKKNFKNMFDIEAAKVLKAGGRFTNADMEGFYEKAEQLGIEDTSFLDDYKTAEEMNLAVSKRKLEAIAQTQGFITPNDLEGLNPLVKDDPDVKGWLQDGTALAGQTSDQKEAFKKTVTRLTNDIYGLTSPDQVKGVQYDAVEQEVRNDLQAAYLANINNPKYSKDGVIDYNLALSDARAQVFQGAKIPRLKGHEDGKDYTNLLSTPTQRLQRGNSQYLERLQLNRDGLMSQGEKFITESKFSTDEEVQQGIDALNGKGNFPALYHDLARGQVNITPYDIAVGQAKAFKLDIAPQPTEAATKQQKASVRRLLEYKPNIHKTERVFTPDMNAPEVVNKNLDRNTRAFVTTVRQLEGTTAGYDVVYGGKRVPGLTQMTLRELYDASKSGGTNRLPARLGGGRIPYHVDGYNSSASGALQLMPQTLLGLVRSGRYSWDTVFSPETQDRMMIDLARDRGVDVSKPLTVRDFNTLGWEWASMARHYGQTSRTPEQSHAIYTQNLRGTQ